jgi:hypothetical protein
MSTRHPIEPSQIDYHADLQAQRVARAKRRIFPGEVLEKIDAAIASESDPRAHPLYPLVQFYLDRETAVHGGEFYDTCRRLVLDAIDRCVDDLLAMED